MNFTESKKRCAIFDMDGTLVNTITDLGNACNYVMKSHGLTPCWREEDYKQFVGNGMKKLVERAFSQALDNETLNEYLSEFKAYYNNHSLDNTKPYEGITEQLHYLKVKGIKLAMVTNKAESAAVSITERLFGNNIFDAIVGQRDGRPEKPAPDGVLEALSRLGCTPQEALYFGDSNVDMQTAVNAGVDAIGVSWGFRSRAELEAYRPKAIIDAPVQIAALFE